MLLEDNLSIANRLRKVEVKLTDSNLELSKLKEMQEEY